MKRKVFICYSTIDSAFAENVESILTDLNVEVYRDRTFLTQDENWRNQIDERIRACERFLFIHTSNSTKSTECNREILVAKEYNKKIHAFDFDKSHRLPMLEEKQYLTYNNDDSQLRMEFIIQLNLNQFSKKDKNNDDLLSEYRECVQKKFTNFDILAKDTKSIELSYVSIELQEGVDFSSKSKSFTSSKINDYFKNSRLLIITGNPGCGKSSLLKFIAHSNSQNSSHYFPIYCNLKDFSYPENYNFEKHVKDAFCSVLNEYGVEYEADKIELFQKKQWIVLLDGLDEVDSNTYNKLIAEIPNFKNIHSQVIIIISTRIDGFKTKRETNFLDARIFTISPLTKPIIEEYIIKWFDNDQQAYPFIKIVLGNDRLFELSKRSIFILGLTCLVYDKNHLINTNLSSIYDAAIEFLLESRNPKGSVIFRIKHEVLKELAFRFLQMQEKRFDKYLSEAIVTKIVTSLGQLYGKPEEFLYAIIQETHLLQQINHKYEFIHLTFQEYLAAQAIFDEESSAEKLLEYCNVNMWEEVFKFYTEMLTNQKKEKFTNEISKKNLSLALRVSAVCENNELMKDIICNSNKNNKLRMLDELESSLATLNEEARKKIILDTIEFLIKHELDSAVLYFAIQLLIKYDSEDERKIMFNNFYQMQDIIYQELISNREYMFELLDIKSGVFTMGYEDSIEQNEKPAHKVKISQFKISKYPLTNKAYEFIMNLNSSNSKRNKYSFSDNQPLINVDWYDAYICALRVGCRLPSEAEWEFAARAGTSTKWWFGDNEHSINEYACCYETNAQTTRNVNEGKENPWGLVDVHGNVWEWCNDWFSDYSPVEQDNPQGPKEGSIRVRRGGGWRYHARGCQSSFRYGNEPYYKYDDIGIRLAKTIL